MEKIDRYYKILFSFNVNSTDYSLLVKMRCQLHTEVAKCLADEDHLATAIEHLDKVLYYYYICLPYLQDFQKFLNNILSIILP